MTIRTDRALTGIVLAAAVALTACARGPVGPVQPYAEKPSVDCGGKQNLTASGSTAQASAITHFTKAYQQACPGADLAYTANGSGAGIREFLAGKTDFAGSDSALAGDEVAAAAKRCAGATAWNIPVVFGPIAITFNLASVDVLTLDGSTLAKIFSGAITRWNDPAITALNRSAPDEAITVIHRSDASGTTDNFQRYLDAASAGAWGKGTGKTFTGGVGQAAKGNEATSATVRDTPGAISYNEYSFAKAQRLSSAQIITPAATAPVPITADTVGKTISTATITGQGNDLVLDTSKFYTPTAAGAYPIVLVTYELVCSTYSDPATGQAVRAFLQSAVAPGQLKLEDHGYFPLPPDFQSRVAAAANAVS
jgi:phosphate transport system substrate-binding protein